MGAINCFAVLCCGEEGHSRQNCKKFNAIKEANGGKVSTVEHVLAALVGMGIDNCLLQINGPEMPIMDGMQATHRIREFLENDMLLEK